MTQTVAKTIIASHNEVCLFFIVIFTLKDGDHVEKRFSSCLVKSVSMKEHVDYDDTRLLDTNYGSPKSVEEIRFTPFNGFVDRNEIDSSVSLSHSPSPVLSVIASPFAAATMKPAHRYSPDSLLLDDICTPFDSDVFGKSTTIRSRLERTTDEKSRIISKHKEAYPEYLNPFSDDHISTHSPLLNEDNIVTPFDKLPDDYIVVESLPNSFYVHCSFNKSDNYISSKHLIGSKRPAPPRPPKLDEALLTRRSFYGGLNSTESDITLRTFDRSQSLRGTRRSSSTGAHLNHSTQRTTHGDTKSVILKRQAPPLPVPGKRMIKADPDDQFINYGELHRMLHEIHQRLTETERNSRALHMRLKQASSKPVNVNELLKQWTKLADIKDSLLKQEANLLERLHRQELEEQHADVEHELRKLLAKQGMFPSIFWSRKFLIMVGLLYYSLQMLSHQTFPPHYCTSCLQLVRISFDRNSI
ncbi:hypothetical protein FGIG_12139 [Fasciola gigantica]|uniref:BMERB domain-containing protein n=1 Tax=Fasciola gigantica TaxID=46835 RepID=A0A504Y6H9_FASGI|nr:hypothetical protein FGIG_12139 [Fasciola gigantica]